MCLSRVRCLQCVEVVSTVAGDFLGGSTTLEGFDMLVAQTGSGLEGIDPRLLAQFPSVMPQYETHIGDDKLRLEALANAARAEVSVKDRGNLLHSYEQCCIGSELITWMVQQLSRVPGSLLVQVRFFQIEDRRHVLPVCNQLLSRKVYAVFISNSTLTHLVGTGLEPQQWRL